MYRRRVVALDTESVGIGPNNRGGVAQVSMVEMYSNKHYNAYIMRQNITDYRTIYSGITPQTLYAKGRPFPEVKEEVLNFIRGAILVGHSIHHDLRGLGITVNQANIRDISKYWYFKQANNGKTPSLVFLADHFLNKTIRKNGRHSCMEDAHTTMQLYRLVANRWEAELEGYDDSDYSDSDCYNSEESYDDYRLYRKYICSDSDSDLPEGFSPLYYKY